MPADIPIIGVRIRGLYGSEWSMAQRDTRPNFGLNFLKGVFYVFANLIFLMPKRNVTIEFVDISDNARINTKGTRREFNQYLEEFYNEAGEEKPVLLKYFFYLPKLK
tara:strand:+ start:64 stop:384 length:321 start_codon:yes stop_codon:yes gene_type:complete